VAKLFVDFRWLCFRSLSAIRFLLVVFLLDWPFDFLGKIDSLRRYPFVKTFVVFVVVNIEMGFSFPL